jgi:Tfp pilus assembly protein FimT
MLSGEGEPAWHCDCETENSQTMKRCCSGEKGMTMMKIKENRGFTLMDTVAALAVSGIMMTMAAPVTSRLLNQYRLRGAASQVAFELTRARMQAVAQNKFVRVRFTGEGAYLLETSQDGGNYTANSPAIKLPSGVALVAGGANSLTFNRQGFVQNSTALAIRNDNGQRTISMNSIGKVTES